MGGKCEYCKNSIPRGACQQGQFLEGAWISLHVQCAELWANEKIDVYTVDWDGEYGHTEACFETVLSYLKDLEMGEKVQIERRQMLRLEYLKLPELE